MEKVSSASSDGLLLCGIWHEPKEAAAKAVILAHGITVDKDEEDIFPVLAERLTQLGFAVFRFDFRGHGESKGASVNMTISGEVLDLQAAYEEVKRRGYQEIGLLGASFGGGIVTLFTANNPEQIKTLCLWNPCLNYDTTLINPTTPWLSATNEVRKQEIQEQGWTTIGSRGFIIGKALYEEMAYTYPFEALKQITIPVAIFHGTDDRYVRIEDSQEYVKNARHGELHVIEGGQHGFQEPTKQREEVLHKTLDFFLSTM